ncbi:MAG TPA: LuxR C-terminal-related transcriptional regulator [Trebonia sp.]|nr:LuxR C-terminal-related transcriptional regulator [Trebonia sp.]
MGEAQNRGADALGDHPENTQAIGGLARPMTAFVGRERERDELRSLFLEGKRLVTLVGMGGIGKTRLALELGSNTTDLGWTSAYLVELASLTNPDLVDGALLEAVAGGPSRAPLQAAVEYLRGATALLVLDCCEHVLDAARRVTEVLLRQCPSVSILATSRSPLDIAGEVVLSVPPLSMERRGAAGEAGASDAARLFVDRASYVRTRLDLNEGVAGAVETIVRRVDGIPLAIELAAARTRVLSIEEIADGLDDHLRLLRSRHRSDPRHQTIRASLDWSHDLLTGQERQLFARLSIFAGGFDLQAATAVCAGGSIAAGDMLDEVEGLVDKSLLAVERKADTTRFRMLDFVRQYAAERLVAAGEDVLLADRHRAYFRELAGRADREHWALTPAGRALLDDDSPNLRAAIDDGCARSPADALAMAGALGLYWRVRGRLAEGLTATEQALAAAPEPSPGRALALAKLSVLSFWVGDFARTLSSATSAMETGTATGDTRSQALALSRLGALVILSDPGTGDPMLLRAADLARSAGDDVALCDALGSLAISYFCQDDPGAMRGPLDETLRVAAAIGYEDDIRWCLWCLAYTAFSAGDLASARAHCERALAMMPGQNQLSRCFAVEVRCLLDAHMGAADAARERAEAELEQSRKEGLLLGTGTLMHALGVAACAADDLDQAAQWATSLYELESGFCHAGWQAQAILVTVALARDDSAQAKIHVAGLLSAAEPLKNPRARAIAHLGLARAVLLEGDDQRAESVTHNALKVLVDHGWRPAAIDALDLLAEVALHRGQRERAVRLIAAAREQRAVLGLVPFPSARKRTERQLADAGTALGDESLKKASEDGARLSFEEAVAYAQRGHGSHASATHGWASLTPAERQVVELASQGLNNPDIAGELFMSRNTVKAHLSHAYAKLRVANRTELARLATRHSHDPQQRGEVLPSWVMFRGRPSASLNFSVLSPIHWLG